MNSAESELKQHSGSELISAECLGDVNPGVNQNYRYLKNLAMAIHLSSAATKWHK